MSRQPTNLGLPSPPGGFVGAPIPQTDPTMETLKSMPDKYSSRWFALYDRMPRTNQVKYNHYLLTKLKKKGWTYSGVVGFINQKRRQAESAEKVKESLDKLAPPPTSEPVAKQEPRARVPFSVPPDVYQQCQQLKKEIDALFKYTDGVEKFPEIDRKPGVAKGTGRHVFVKGRLQRPTAAGDNNINAFQRISRPDSNIITKIAQIRTFSNLEPGGRG